MQIHEELNNLRDHLHTTRSAVQDAERKLQFMDKLCPSDPDKIEDYDRKLDFLVKLWLADPRKLQIMEKLGLIDARKYQFMEKLRPSDTIKDVERKLQDTEMIQLTNIEDAERKFRFLVELWLADAMEVLNDVKDKLYDEIMDANISRLIVEVQSSANKPWKLILNLFNKISRFMHDREKETASKVKDTIVRLRGILDEATQLGLQYRLTKPGIILPPFEFAIFLH
ncbi:hypothetical protein SLA2020_053080 [Shorea laevis]